MSGKEQNVILLTGQSGMKINRSLTKLVEKGFNARLFPFETIMKESSALSFLEILALPPIVQEKLWTQTFQRIESELVSSQQGYSLLIFHASWYHQKKSEFLSPVDFAKLETLRDSVKMVAVFVDDCYDIYRRLLGEGEMFGSVRELAENDPKRALLESIPNLVNILDWREIEIAFSRKIARLLGVPFYIVAVKHPGWMLQRLIKAGPDSNIFYLSHPISSIVKRIEPRPSGFYQELNSFIEKELAKEESILFIPDTIDEKGRIREENGKYVPELLDGWPLPFAEDWLFTPLPAAVKSINPLNPGNFDTRGAEDQFRAAVSFLLEMVLKRISNQINSRDLSLVEQSKNGVILYRPYAGAKTPGGVEEELKYNKELRENHGENQRRTVIIDTFEDLAKWRIASLFEYLKNGIDLDKHQQKALDNLCEDWLDTTDVISQFKNLSANNRASIRESIEIILPSTYGFHSSMIPPRSSTLISAAMLAKEEAMNAGWQSVFDRVSIDNPFRQKYVERQQDSYIIQSVAELRQKLQELVDSSFPACVQEQKGPQDEPK